MPDTELDRRLAILAGRTPGEQDWWEAPAYSDSIDAQHRDLDPLVEAKWGRFDEDVAWQTLDQEWLHEFYTVPLPMRAFAKGTGSKKVSARAAAIEAALGETS